MDARLGCRKALAPDKFYLVGMILPASASIVSKVMPSSARVVVDAIGHLHVALLDRYPPTQSGITVRYLEIGP